MSSLVTEDQLMEWLDIHQRARLEKRLRALKIRYVYGARNRICTTQRAIDMALIDNQSETEEIEFDE